MSDDQNNNQNPEKILTALDEVEQTIEVMTNVVDQLKDQLHNEFRQGEQVAQIAQHSIEHNVAPQHIVH
ncbi:MAG: hypothetical protein COB04_03095 [Gammaproteobacteria bacterium]|nr:MAG: hypothetical protein COB04_03095 [Gammaproteobacteria bacterium]